MKKLNSQEINGKMKRSWYLQISDIKAIKELKLPAPSFILDINKTKEADLEDFILIEDPMAFEFIANQWWILDYLIIKGMSIFEIDMAISKIAKDIDKLRILIKDKDTPKEALIDLKNDLIIKRNNLIAFNTLKKEELENLKYTRK